MTYFGIEDGRYKKHLTCCPYNCCLDNCSTYNCSTYNCTHNCLPYNAAPTTAAPTCSTYNCCTYNCCPNNCCTYNWCAYNCISYDCSTYTCCPYNCRATMMKNQLTPVFQKAFPSSFESLDVVSFSNGSIINVIDVSFVSTSAPNSTQIANTLINAASTVIGFDIEGSSISLPVG
ncbi:hypothetical protein F7725_004496 [Dissostichus mawsoni]|uniref:Uncharacterized protein n=1 Tax=Dissostichus mawsoni TaxID=36200 RepID=A0A7J5XIV7_DISMA|nr:hypothetical protein F7725_004496 [Dissostichus mawsoni]